VPPYDVATEHNRLDKENMHACLTGVASGIWFKKRSDRIIGLESGAEIFFAKKKGRNKKTLQKWA